MVSNSVTLFRMALTIPLFLVLAIIGPSWTALALFLGAGALDVVDGKLARRLNESSEFGAMIDLIADRLLTLAAVAGLLAANTLSLPAAGAGLVLVARCHIFASFGEALQGRKKLSDAPLEPIKIIFAFGGLGLAMTPHPRWEFLTVPLIDLSAILLISAALLTAATLVGYSQTTISALTNADRR